MRDFAGDPGIVGRTVKLEGRSHTVVGVMPPKFSFPDEAEFWLPLPRRPVIEGAKGQPGRLHEGVLDRTREGHGGMERVGPAGEAGELGPGRRRIGGLVEHRAV